MPDPQHLSVTEAAEVLGVKSQTVKRRMKKGMPVATWHGRRPFFDRDAILDWCAAQGLDGSRGRPSKQKVLDADAARERAKLIAARTDAKRADLERVGPQRATLAKAELAQKMVRAKRMEQDLKAEQALKELGLGDKIREAKTNAEIQKIGTEVAALMADGTITTNRGRGLQGMLAEIRKTIAQKHKHAPPERNEDSVTVVSPEGAALARAFEAIASDDLRMAVMEFVADAADRDLEEHPATDLGGVG